MTIKKVDQNYNKELRKKKKREYYQKNRIKILEYQRQRHIKKQEDYFNSNPILKDYKPKRKIKHLSDEEKKAIKKEQNKRYYEKRKKRLSYFS